MQGLVGELVNTVDRGRDVTFALEQVGTSYFAECLSIEHENKVRVGFVGREHHAQQDSVVFGAGTGARYEDTLAWVKVVRLFPYLRFLCLRV